METENEYPDGQGQSRDDKKYTGQDQNNNGNIGREVEEEKDNVKSNIKANTSEANDSGIEENQQSHWSAENIAGTPQREDPPASGRTDPDNPEINVENVGGTSAED